MRIWPVFMILMFCGFFFSSFVFAEGTLKRPIVEEMSEKDKESMIKQLLIEGDQLTKQKDYNLANASYESIFLIQPDHLEASKRIDQLKKIMVREGVSESQLVTGVYDQEIDIRVKQYLSQAKDLIQQGKFAQARFSLQKLLLMDPLHQEATKLYNQVKKHLEQAA